MGCGASSRPVIPGPGSPQPSTGSRAPASKGAGEGEGESETKVSPSLSAGTGASRGAPGHGGAGGALGGDATGSSAAAVPLENTLSSVTAMQAPSRVVTRLMGSQQQVPGSPALDPATPGRARWKKGELIGTGAYGRVYIGLNEVTGGLMAVKEVRFSPEDKLEVEALRNEIELMGSLAHENIVRYLGTQVGPGHVLNIFTEWVPGGSLHALVLKFGRLADSVISKYTQQILAGLCYLHDKRVVHRDIKGANILVTDLGVIKVADFGASRVISDSTLDDKSSDKLHGTPNFMAPEVILSKDAGRKADVWSLGCTVFQMATGSPPWKALRFENVTSLLFHIANTKDPPPIPSYVSPALLSFLMITFQRNAQQRPAIRELMQHPFVVDAPGEGSGSEPPLPTEDRLPVPAGSATVRPTVRPTIRPAAGADGVADTAGAAGAELEMQSFTSRPLLDDFSLTHSTVVGGSGGGGSGPEAAATVAAGSDATLGPGGTGGGGTGGGPGTLTAARPFWDRDMNMSSLHSLGSTNRRPLAPLDLSPSGTGSTRQGMGSSGPLTPIDRGDGIAPDPVPEITLNDFLREQIAEQFGSWTQGGFCAPEALERAPTAMAAGGRELQGQPLNPLDRSSPPPRGRANSRGEFMDSWQSHQEHRIETRSSQRLKEDEMNHTRLVAIRNRQKQEQWEEELKRELEFQLKTGLR